MATTRVILNCTWNNKTKAEEASGEDIGISEAVQKVARKELREDKKIREQSLEQFREWLKKNPDVANIRTDDVFLLKFLRAKKFSIPMAQQLLLKFLNFKQVFRHLTVNLDFMEPGVLRLINQGYLVPSPIRDKHGRKVIIGFASKKSSFNHLFTMSNSNPNILENFDPEEHTSSDMSRTHFITYETLLEDPENQIMGFVHVGDFQGVTTSHIACWNPTDFLRIMKWGEQSVPMRHKEIHFCNIPSPIKWVIDVGKTRVSNKIKDRLHVSVSV